MTPRLDELTIADSPAAWRNCGFEVDGDLCTIGAVRLRLLGDDAADGVVEWALGGIEDGADLDGLPTSVSAGPVSAPSTHPNGVTGLDHVVVISPDLDRTVAALEEAGLDLRRIREEPTPAGAPRQAFFRLGEPILEVVQAPPEAIERNGGPGGPAFFWGLALIAPDLDASVDAIGEGAGEPRDAVQPGRRIATLKRSAGLALPVALMTPPSRDGGG
ncbi:MAG TPA: hypothetical protein VIT85_00715 [Solirubrobacterales bacterium]